MPPKPKFTKKEIINAAIDIIRDGGIHEITAREIGKRMQASSSPIFTVFKNMDELKTEILRTLLEDYNSQSRFFDQSKPLFKQYGEQLVRYAIEQPNLFKYLFLQQTDVKINSALKTQSEQLPRECYEILAKTYSLNEEQIRKLFNEVWIFTFGLATLCALGAAKPSEERISETLTDMFSGALAKIKEKS